MENRLIHRMKVNDDMAVLDVNSGAVHLIDKPVYDVLGVFDGMNDEETVAALKDTYDEAELREILAELHELKDQGLLFSPEFDVPETFATEPVLKSLCLHVAHDCNLRCKYCFADTGDFGGGRELMSAETGRKAIDFAIKGSRKRHNLEIDLFGGEPLVNFDVVKEIVRYARQREKETGKNIKLTLTTNGTLLNDENIKFLNDNHIMLVLSLDGGKEMHDRMRPFPNQTGSYDAAVRGFRKVIRSRKGWNYYLRGTYTHFSTHFADEVLKMLDVGKRNFDGTRGRHDGAVRPDGRRPAGPVQGIRQTGGGVPETPPRPGRTFRFLPLQRGPRQRPLCGETAGRVRRRP
jgi:uncharacterized protein